MTGMHPQRLAARLAGIVERIRCMGPTADVRLKSAIDDLFLYGIPDPQAREPVGILAAHQAKE